MRTALTSLFLLAALPACFRTNSPDEVANTKLREPPVVAPLFADDCPAPDAPLKKLDSVAAYNAHLGPCGDLVTYNGAKNMLRDVRGVETELAGAFEDFDATGDLLAVRIMRPISGDQLAEVPAFLNVRTGVALTPTAALAPTRGGFGYDATNKQSYGIAYKSNAKVGAIERWAPGKVYSAVDVAAPSEMVAYARRGSLVVGRETASPNRAVVTDLAARTSTNLPIELWRSAAVWMNETGELMVVQNYAEASGAGYVLVSTKLYRPKDGALLADVGRTELIAPGQSHDPKEVREVDGTVVFEQKMGQILGGPASPWATAEWRAAPKTLRVAVDVKTGQVLDAQKTTPPAAQGRYLGVVADGRIAYAAPSLATRAPEVVNRSGAAWLVDVATGGETQIAEFGVGSRATAVSPDGSAVVYVTEQGAPGVQTSMWRGPSLVPSFAQSPYADGAFAANGTAFTADGGPRGGEWMLQAWAPGAAAPRTFEQVVSDRPIVALYNNTAVYMPLLMATTEDVAVFRLGVLDTSSTSAATSTYVDFDGMFNAQSYAEVRPSHGRARLFTVHFKGAGIKDTVFHGVLPVAPKVPVVVQAG